MSDHYAVHLTLIKILLTVNCNSKVKINITATPPLTLLQKKREGEIPVGWRSGGLSEPVRPQPNSPCRCLSLTGNQCVSSAQFRNGIILSGGGGVFDLLLLIGSKPS